MPAPPANKIGRAVPRVAVAECFEQQRIGKFGRPHHAPAHRRTTAIREVTSFIRLLRGSQSLFDGAGSALRSRSFPAAIIVAGVPAQSAAVAHMARTDARPTAAVGWDRATRAT